METLNKEIGLRLREIRNVANEGGNLSARQFAHLLGETTDKILNYENGRAAVTPQLLISLYHRGFSPVWLLTGDGTMLIAGEKTETPKPEIKGNVELLGYNPDFGITIKEMIRQAGQYSAAAGDILKAIEQKTSDEGLK